MFDDLDPALDFRLDWGIAHIVQAILRDGQPLKDFMLDMGDYQKAPKVKQTVQQQEFLLDAWIFGSNKAFEAKEAARKR